MPEDFFSRPSLTRPLANKEHALPKTELGPERAVVEPGRDPVCSCERADSFEDSVDLRILPAAALTPWFTFKRDPALETSGEGRGRPASADRNLEGGRAHGILRIPWSGREGQPGPSPCRRAGSAGVGGL